MKLRLDPAIAAWVLCGVFLVVMALVASSQLEGEPDYERAAREKLEQLTAAPPGTIRVIVLGNSRSQNAFGHQPDLESVLHEAMTHGAGADVAIADLSGPALQLNTMTPLLGDIFGVEPDVIVLQSGSIPDTASPVERSLAGRVRIKLGLQGPARTGTPGCQERSAEALDEITLATRDRYDTTIDFGRADDLVNRAAAAGVNVYLVEIPRAGELLANVGDLVVEYRSDIEQRYGGLRHVTIGPTIELPRRDHYCDYTHLSEDGQRHFLDLWLPEFVTYLQQVAAE